MSMSDQMDIVMKRYDGKDQIDADKAQEQAMAELRKSIGKSGSGSRASPGRSSQGAKLEGAAAAHQGFLFSPIDDLNNRGSSVGKGKRSTDARKARQTGTLG